MGKTPKIWFLEKIDLFELLCPTKFKESESSRRMLSFRKSEFIYLPEDASAEIYLLHKGRIKIGTNSGDGREVIKAILGEGELFGELALSGEKTRSDFAQALEDSEICVLSLAEIEALMKDSVEFSIKITRLIGQKLFVAERRLESLVFKDARTRIIEYICEAADNAGKKVGTEILIPGILTHREIAHITGTSRQTVTTVLNELRDKNYIYFDRKRILVRDLGSFRALAAPLPQPGR